MFATALAYALDIKDVRHVNVEFYTDAGETLPEPVLIGQPPYLSDLGGKRVRLVPRSGHTASDVTVQLEEPKVVWCGDLVWNGMFPNYVDALPSALTEHAGQILARTKTTFVPGHGDIPDAKQVASFLGLLQDVEAAARKAFELGKPAAEAAEAYEVPESLGEWQLFSPAFPGRAFAAWERELQGDG